MNGADRYGHRFELSPEGALSVMPLPDVGHAVVDRDPALTVTLYQLGADGRYVEHVKMPLDWLLNTPAAEHLD
jgi:hypothetical protein